ncbi:MAG: hypothetical protein GWN07_02790 [Actinobacteria bacterium]|nr:hypothetical protein [Actinomycetota bacterium]NIU64433.1 hypothetical protein [Actinomycetota bacterium]NIW26236.1 hypothetical protein [Actinomycetota bacterium]NIX18817.1 hypothetical protein [Actinomycetota bacterium]
MYDRYRLGAGATLDGPVVLVEPESTLVVPVEARVRVLEGGTVEVVTDDPAASRSEVAA